MEVSNYEELYKKLGISMNVIKSGAMKDIGSSARPMTETERDLLQTMVDDIYEQFVAVVAEGRKMDPARVREIADGRIFTGRQAKDAGLVDDMGNFNDAFRIAAETVGLKGGYNVKEFGTVSPWEILLSEIGSIGKIAGSSRMLPERLMLLPEYLGAMQ